MLDQDEKQADLDKQVTHVLEECRMILPGIQALFGFQLIAVFNQGFDRLPGVHKALHIAAIVAVAAATVFVMTPAAYHRQVEPEQVSERFVRLATRFLIASMAFLGLGMSLDLFVVVFAVFRSWAVGILLSGSLLSLLVGLWFVLPACCLPKRSARGSSR